MKKGALLTENICLRPSRLEPVKTTFIVSLCISKAVRKLAIVVLYFELAKA
jgi:hypothetical protein